MFPFDKGPKFSKGFKMEDGKVTGYNVKMKLDLVSFSPIKKPWRYVHGKDGLQQLFGFFDIRPAIDEPVHNLYPNALLFDYSSIAKNPFPLCGTMDYVVEVN